MAIRTQTLYRDLVRPGLHPDRFYWAEQDGIWWECTGSDPRTTCEGVLQPRTWGKYELLAVGLGGDDLSSPEYHVVEVGKDEEDTIVLLPSTGSPEADRCLVLVHEEAPGTGRKRFPSFKIDWDNAGDIEVLAQASRGKGSGWDGWTLIIAPADWAENIASQFIEGRDEADQTIAYRPGVASRITAGDKVIEFEDEPLEQDRQKDAPMSSMETAMQEAGLL